MKLSRYLLAALLYALPTAAYAQCSGVFAAGNVCGNSTAAGAPAGSTTVNALFNRVFGSTANQIIYNNAGTWAALPSANSSILITNGSGVPSWSSSALPSGVFANPSASIGLSAVNGSATTAMRSDAAPALSQAIIPTWTGTHTFGNTTLAAQFNGGGIAINPTTLTLNPGFNITQTGPTGGSVVGPTNFNLINAYYNSTTTGVTQTDFGAWVSDVSGLRVNLTTGPNASGQAIEAGLFHIRHTSASLFGDIVGLGAIAYSNAAGPASGNLYAAATSVTADSGAVWNQITGLEIETRIIGTGSSQIRIGLNVINSGTGQAATAYDTAIGFAASGVGGYKNLLYIASGTPVLDTAANIFASASAITVANIFSASNVTVTGSILNFPNATLSGAGTSAWPIVAGGSAAGSTLTLESTTGAGTTDAILFKTASQVQRGAINTSGQWTLGPNFAPISGVKLTVNANAAAPVTNFGQVVTQIVAADGTNNVNLWDSFTTSGSSILTLRRARGTAASFSAVQSGDSLGGISFIGASAANTFINETGSNGGAFIAATSSENWSVTNQGTRLTFYTTPNTTAAIGAAAVLSNSGGLTVGGSTEVAAGVINGVTGFRVNNAATSGNVLRGNGTNFVGAALAASDLSNGTSGSGAVCLVTSCVMVTPTLGVANGTSLGLGNNSALNSGVELQLNANSGALPAGTFSGTIMQLAGANATAARIYLDTFGANSSFVFRRSNNTLASRTAVANGDTIGAFFWDGFDGTGYNASDAPSVLGVATENFTTSAHGTAIKISTVANGGLGAALSAQFHQSTGVSIGTTTDPGAGSLQVNAKIFAPNLTSTTAALSGAVCMVVTTGEFQKDTNAGGCLASFRASKNILASLDPAGSLDIVMRLDPIDYRYKPGYGDGGQYEQVGFIAEDVAAIDPRLAAIGPDGQPNGVRYMQITAVLASAIQRLKADNDNLREKIQTLKRQTR